MDIQYERHCIMLNVIQESKTIVIVEVPAREHRKLSPGL